MPIEIIYRTLFSVHIDHDYLLDLAKAEFASLPADLQRKLLRHYDLANFISISPTSETEKIFAQHKLRLRQTPAGFDVFASVERDDAFFKLIYELAANTILRFEIRLRENDFAREANLSLDANTRDLYHFSNANEHTSAGKLQLTRPVPVFDPASSYRAGDLVVTDANTPTVLLEAFSDQVPAADPVDGKWLKLPFAEYENGTNYLAGDLVLSDGVCYESQSEGTHNAPATAEWKEIFTPELSNGVTRADLFKSFSSVFTISAPSDDIKFAMISIKDTNNLEVFNKAYFHDTQEPIDKLVVDATSLSPGFYTIDARESDNTAFPGFPFTFYLHPNPSKDRPFGIIEIENRAGSHAILDGDKRLLSPNFHIRFRKRHTHWRYVFHGDLSEFPPDELGDLEQEDPQDNSRYVSKLPLPLTVGVHPLQNFNANIQLPNPGTASVFRDGGKIVSETYIHS